MESSAQQTWIASEVTYFVFVWSSREVRYTGLIWNSHKLLLPFSIFVSPPPHPPRCPPSYAFPGHFYQGPHQTLLLHKVSSCWLEQQCWICLSSWWSSPFHPWTQSYTHGFITPLQLQFPPHGGQASNGACVPTFCIVLSSPDTHYARLMCNQWDSAEIANCDCLDLVTKGAKVFFLHSADPWPWEKPGAMSWGQSSIPLKRSIWGRNEASCQCLAEDVRGIVSPHGGRSSFIYAFRWLGPQKRVWLQTCERSWLKSTISKGTPEYLAYRTCKIITAYLSHWVWG